MGHPPPPMTPKAIHNSQLCLRSNGCHRYLRTAERLLTAAVEAKVASPRTIINFCEFGGNHTDQGHNMAVMAAHATDIALYESHATTLPFTRVPPALAHMTSRASLLATTMTSTAAAACTTRVVRMARLQMST
eukprot:scaffold28660_cov111-Isochrysis_galbana.AAC.1